MTQHAIQVRNLWKKFRKGQMHDSLREWIPALAKQVWRGRGSRDLAEQEFWALRDVSFEVEKGQSLGIIGPNGAGKSTMFKVLSRILRPNRGSYTVNGRLSALIEVGAGFHGDLTGRENIYLNGSILGMKRAEIKSKEDRIIDFADMSEFIDTPVKRYSSGMMARLGFAVAAHMEPDVLLVDEVLSVGDARFRQKCIRHMRDLLNSHVTVVFISHILEQVRQLCPRTIVLDRGQIIHNGSTEQAIKVYLDALLKADHQDDGPLAQTPPAELRNIRVCDAHGKEVLEWRSRQPGVVEMTLHKRQPVDNPAVVLNISSIGGVYLGSATARSDWGTTIPGEAGDTLLRFVFDPMPLADGDYFLDLSVFEVASGKCLWATRQPRNVSVRGGGDSGMLLRVDGRWQVQPQPVASAAAVHTPGASLAET